MFCAPNIFLAYIVQVDILFSRGSIEGGDGFNITVRQIECNNRKKYSRCGGELSGETIHIQSPGYPFSYPEELDCRYTISATDSGVCQLEVRLQNTSLEESLHCTKDSLQIGEDIFCGNLNGVRTYKINKQLNITFKTDLEGNSKGFNMTIRQIRCVDVNSAALNEKLASDKQDTSFECDPGTYPSVARDGYTDFFPQYHPVLSRPTDNGNSLQYFTQFYNQGNQRVPSEFTPNRVPPYSSSMNPFYSTSNQPNFVQFQSRPVQNFPSLSYGSPVYRTPIYQSPQFVPPYRQQSSYIPNVNSRPYTPSVSNSYWPVQSVVRQTTSLYQQCCNQIYADSHFLLVSPGFPRSTTTDCIYTITRYSTLTYQIRFQFRYFWAGEDLGTGCSGGYLEIDGTKICGCKTGRSWTSQFTLSETSKTLHLKLDTQFSRLFNGFVLEVYQDDSYTQRYLRATGPDLESTADVTESTIGKVANFSQYVETFVEREPVLPTNDEYPYLDRAGAQPTWEYSRQSGSLSTDWFCLRWNFQDWLVLAREVLWAKYQCPASSSSSSSSTRSDMTQSDPCRTCLYLCRQNCQCCQ